MRGEGAFLTIDPVADDGLDFTVVENKLGMFPFAAVFDKAFHVWAYIVRMLRNSRLMALAYIVADSESAAKGCKKAKNKFEHRKL